MYSYAWPLETTCSRMFAACSSMFPWHLLRETSSIVSPCKLSGDLPIYFPGWRLSLKISAPTKGAYNIKSTSSGSAPEKVVWFTRLKFRLYFPSRFSPWPTEIEKNTAIKLTFTASADDLEFYPQSLLSSLQVIAHHS